MSGAGFMLHLGKQLAAAKGFVDAFRPGAAHSGTTEADHKGRCIPSSARGLHSAKACTYGGVCGAGRSFDSFVRAEESQGQVAGLAFEGSIGRVDRRRNPALYGTHLLPE